MALAEAGKENGPDSRGNFLMELPASSSHHPAPAEIHSEVNVWTGHNDDDDDDNSRRMCPKLTADSGRNAYKIIPFPPIMNLYHKLSMSFEMLRDLYETWLIVAIGTLVRWNRWSPLIHGISIATGSLP
ncbi:GD24667 [Drosophila simulans]|uniref:GD24667 n=1 Tax=Drosophila simulans TaxID=7240 RepID=B4NTN9_DROSI|nr:GD24667 [Drosophila simulans]